MSRSSDSGQIDLAEVFYSVQEEMLAQLAVGNFFEHPTASGTATERHWLDLFDRYLPKRYQATPAFVIDDRADFDLVFANPDGSPLRPDSVSASISLLCRRLKLPPGSIVPIVGGTVGQTTTESATSISIRSRPTCSGPLLPGGPSPTFQAGRTCSHLVDNVCVNGKLWGGLIEHAGCLLGSRGNQ
jgi:hypothetical protein